VWQGVRHPLAPGETQPGTHGGKAVHVHLVWKEIPRERSAEETLSYSHGVVILSPRERSAEKNNT